LPVLDILQVTAFAMFIGYIQLWRRCGLLAWCYHSAELPVDMKSRHHRISATECWFLPSTALSSKMWRWLHILRNDWQGACQDTVLRVTPEETEESHEKCQSVVSHTQPKLCQIPPKHKSCMLTTSSTWVIWKISCHE